MTATNVVRRLHADIARRLEAGYIDGCDIRARGTNTVVSLRREGYQVNVEIALWVVAAAYYPDEYITGLLDRAVDNLRRAAGDVP